MFKKSKIRSDFIEAYKRGDEQTIERLLNENPWLVNEWEAMQGGDTDSLVVLAALGVMEDELTKPAPLEEISFCLRVDFKKKMDDNKILSLLQENQTLGYCQQVGNEWQLTPEGERLVDNYLNSHSA